MNKAYIVIPPSDGFFTFAAIDLLERMLDLDPDTRITAEGALSHPYLAQYADPTDEPTSEPYDSTFEERDYEIPIWRSKRVVKVVGVPVKEREPESDGFLCLSQLGHVNTILKKKSTSIFVFALLEEFVNTLALANVTN